MTHVQEIEKAIRELPDGDKKSLVLKINDLYWDAWDEQLERDFAAGRLDALMAEAEADIKQGRTKPLDELLRDT